MRTLLLALCLSCLPLCLQAQAPGGKPITLESIWKEGKFNPRGLQGLRWMKDGNYYTALDQNRIVQYDVKTGTSVRTLVDGPSLGLKIADYELASDERKILMLTDVEPIYRHSFKAQYFVFDPATGKATPLSQNGPQSYATLSPDGQKVAFARDNNLFYVDLNSGQETAVTSGGQFNQHIYGSTDWVYEEEFGFAKGFDWSADSRKLAFYAFDEGKVKEYNMQVWNNQGPYPADYRFKYPKAGEDNSRVAIRIYDLGSGKTIEPALGQEQDQYLPRMRWTGNPELLSVLRLNRLQNHAELLHVRASDGQVASVLEEKADTYVDIEYNDHLTYLQDGKHFIASSERSGYKHLYLYDMQGKLLRPITQGAWEVTDLVGIDQRGKTPVVYYMSTENSPLNRDLFSIDLQGKRKQQLSAPGSSQVNMSPDTQYYIASHSSNSEVPTVSLKQTKGNKTLKVIEDNQAYAQRVREYGFVPKEAFSFTTSEGVQLNGYMLRPAKLEAGKQYPVLMFQYSGPGSNQVENAWGGGNYAWHQMLTQQGYVIAVVDGRGTGKRGRDFKHVTYGQLGKLEALDQIETAKYLKTLPYVDAGRIGIWGWSFGGYMSSLCLLTGAEHFKAAIAVAPVTNWRLYDSIYTERYLKRPQDNPSGYDDNSPLQHAGKLKGNFLLVHGTGDDNVHVQNALLLQNALIRSGKQFESFYYPDRNHGIYGGNTRLHLYELMTDFLKRKL